jgi:uncharacterized protein YjeT (DUF2065 family)
MPIAAATVSAAEELIAWLMPDAWKKLAPAMRSALRPAGVMRLAAEPWRR